MRLAHAGMDSGWVLAGGQLIEEFLVLVGNPFPVVYPVNSLRCGLPKLASKLDILFYEIDLVCQVSAIGKEEAATAQNFRVELIVSREHATPVPESVKQ